MSQLSKTLSEAESKKRLADVGVPFLAEHIVGNAAEAANAAELIGFPVVLKLNGDQIAHKTERGLVKLNLGSADAVLSAADELLAAATPQDGEVSILVAPFVKSNREFICGLSRDPQFGPTVLFGVGGILAEAIADVVIRLAPITEPEAHDMIDGLTTQALLESFRGEPAVDREALAQLLVGLAKLGEDASIAAVDLNPVLIVEGTPVAVDALIELGADVSNA